MIENFTSYSYYNDLIISLFCDEMISYVNEEDMNVEINIFFIQSKAILHPMRINILLI